MDFSVRIQVTFCEQYSVILLFHMQRYKVILNFVLLSFGSSVLNFLQQIKRISKFSMNISRTLMDCNALKGGGESGDVKGG